MKAKVMPEDASTELETSTSGVPPKKRASTKGKRKAGKLEGIMIMPLDVLFEIFSFLRPLDILYLSRTTKEFGRVLMNRNNIFIWKAARANIPNYPECFEDMNEAQMARLAFEPHCYVCFKPNCRTVDWVFRVRLCPNDKIQSLVDVIPLLDSLKKGVAILACTKEWSRSRTLAFSEEIASVTAHWATLKNEEEEEAYIQQRTVLKSRVNDHAIICMLWLESQRTDRSNELREARNDRKAAIIKKLAELGWGPEIEKITYTIGEHRLVKQPTRLTPRIWTNIKPEMIKYLEQIKHIRLERERPQVMATRKRTAIEAIRAYKVSLLPWAEVMPEPPDYCQMAPVKAILELPTDIAVDVSSFASVIPQLSSLFAEWRQKLHRHMVLRLFPSQESLATVPVVEPLNPEVVRILPLATTPFECIRCLGDDPFTCEFDTSTSKGRLEPLFYPEALNHPCLTQELSPESGQSDDLKLDKQPGRRRKEWTSTQLRLDLVGSHIMFKIVLFCNVDASCTTVADLDKLDVWLGCPDCAYWWGGPNEAEVPVFGWRNAYKHQVQVHSSEPINWLELSEDQKRQAVTGAPEGSFKAGQHEMSRMPSTTIARWSCVHCMDRTCEGTPQTMVDITKHLLEEHEVTVPQVDVDCHTFAGKKEFAHRESWATFAIQQPPEETANLKLLAQDMAAALNLGYITTNSTCQDHLDNAMEAYWRDHGHATELND
ncbi:hypothetical protein FIBSPDRAFT_958678 [Athelia psychrophila]|uniref:F-box domain-containing protein n=1 Tax=Athelia psychrophila TaxID=1759441 RepID=A0A166EE47_9AGAM|nr:hypothetical protein FIBSPDRAFT_958678 [Fibularhizoctonia sp. CBS 109695]